MSDRQLEVTSRCHPDFTFKYPKEWEAAAIEFLDILIELRASEITSKDEQLKFIERRIRERIDVNYPSENSAVLACIITVFLIATNNQWKPHALESTREVLEIIQHVITFARVRGLEDDTPEKNEQYFLREHGIDIEADHTAMVKRLKAKGIWVEDMIDDLKAKGTWVDDTLE